MFSTDQYSHQRLANTMEMDRINQEELKEKKKQSIISQGSEQPFFEIVSGGVSALGSTLGTDSAWKINAFLKIDQNLFRPLTLARMDMCALKPQFWESRFQSASCDQRNDFTFYHLFYQHIFPSHCYCLCWCCLDCELEPGVSYLRVTGCSFSVCFHLSLKNLMEPRKKKLDEISGVYVLPFITTQRCAQIHKNLIW